MQLKVSSFIIATLISINLFAQKTIILQPGSEQGKDARINSLNRYTSGKTSEFAISAWTFNGNFGIDRSLIQFDLLSINKGAKVRQAKLYLYGARKLSSGGHSTLSGSNEVLIQRITSVWDEHTVTWNNQPAVSGVNEVVVPASTNEYQNYSIDVTNLVQDMVNDPKNSYGFMLRQLTENYYRRMNFASSDHQDPNKWPKLNVTLEDTEMVSNKIGDGNFSKSVRGKLHTLIIQPGPIKGKDSRVNSIEKHTSGKANIFIASVWTYQGTEGIDRSFIEFDLSLIKTNAKIKEAKLYLYAATERTEAHHSKLSGTNEMLVQRVTGPWDENLINWSTKPTTSDQNQIITPASKSDYQDYIIDVTNLVQDMVNMPENSHGFMFRQLTEQYYRRMNFASSDYHDPDKWPKLVISYYKNIGEYKAENSEEEDEMFLGQENSLPDPGDMINIYPKYTKNLIYIDNGAYMRIKNYKLNIIDKHSNILYKSIISDKNFKIDISQIGVPGTYFVKILNLKDEIIDIQKVIVE